GVMGVAGLLWGAAALRERAATCEGRWTAGAAGARAATVRLGDPAPHSGGPVEAYVVAGPCGGALRLRWPDGIPAAGGTTWVAAGRWVGVGVGVGSGGRGVLVVRRAKLLDAEPRGRGAGGVGRPGRAGGGARQAARRRAAGAGGAAGPARRAQRRTVRPTGADRGRAGVRAQRATRP